MWLCDPSSTCDLLTAQIRHSNVFQIFGRREGGLNLEFKIGLPHKIFNKFDQN